MPQRFTEQLREAAEPIWRAQHEHPFIQGIADGSLDVEKFKHWVRQDYRFLMEYTRQFAFAAGRAPDLATMTWLVQLAHETLHTELSLHRAYAEKFGVSVEEMEREALAPTCQAYTDFLVRTAATGSFPEAIGALLPCMWGFSELGKRVAEHAAPDDERYAEWVAMYASGEFAELAAVCRGIMDRVAEGLPERDLDAVKRAFLTSSRYEYLFWEMAWRQEQWPV
ncbi:MAG: thiaminase II [Dehalococcoidia bacterium]